MDDQHTKRILLHATGGLACMLIHVIMGTVAIHSSGSTLLNAWSEALAHMRSSGLFWLWQAAPSVFIVEATWFMYVKRWITGPSLLFAHALLLLLLLYSIPSLSYWEDYAGGKLSSTSGLMFLVLPVYGILMEGFFLGCVGFWFWRRAQKPWISGQS